MYIYKSIHICSHIELTDIRVVLLYACTNVSDKWQIGISYYWIYFILFCSTCLPFFLPVVVFIFPSCLPCIHLTFLLFSLSDSFSPHFFSKEHFFLIHICQTTESRKQFRGDFLENRITSFQASAWSSCFFFPSFFRDVVFFLPSFHPSIFPSFSVPYLIASYHILFKRMIRFIFHWYKSSKKQSPGCNLGGPPLRSAFLHSRRHRPDPADQGKPGSGNGVLVGGYPLPPLRSLSMLPLAHEFRAADIWS